jgi:hypothetical protein
VTHLHIFFIFLAIWWVLGFIPCIWEVFTSKWSSLTVGELLWFMVIGFFGIFLEPEFWGKAISRPIRRILNFELIRGRNGS